MKPKRRVVDTVTSLSEEQFNKLYYNFEPVLIKGGISQTRACQMWTLDYLKQKVGSRIVKFAYSEASNFSIAFKEIFWLDGAFDKLVEMITTGSTSNDSFVYMGQQSITSHFPELLEDLVPPSFIQDTDLLSSINLWIGREGCRAGLHFDNYHNFFCQILGKKEILLFSPEDSPYLYPCKEKGKERVSQVQVQNTDYRSFPRYKESEQVYCMVEAGDILYIPLGWWHDVLTVEMSISVNYWWQRFDVPRKGIPFMEIDEVYAIVKYFTSKGFSIDHRDLEGETLLIKAVRNNYPKIVEALLKQGANLNLESKDKPARPALSIAQENNQTQIVELLMKYAAHAGVMQN